MARAKKAEKQAEIKALTLDDVFVYVQTCPQRRETRSETLASLDASDARGQYTVIEHPPGVHAQQFYVDALRQAQASGKAIVVRLEDDVDVNRHLLRNVLAWPALREPAFGMGFLSNSNGYTPPFARTASGAFRALRPDLSAALGQVWRADGLAEFIAHLEQHQHHRDALSTVKRINYDHVMSRTCTELGRGVYVHFPALVRENRIGLTCSSWGNNGQPGWHPPQPDFSATWSAVAPRVVVSMTTHPGRNGQAQPAVNSILAQTRPPDEIRLYYGPGCKDLPTGCTLIEVVDRGPLTKLSAGVAPDLPPETIVVTADDDILYHPMWLQMLVDAAQANPQDACGFSAWSVSELVQNHRFETYPRPSVCDVLEGFAGVAYRRGFFDDDVMQPPEEFRFVDDVWISAYLRRRGITRRKVGPAAQLLVTSDERPGLHNTRDFVKLNREACLIGFPSAPVPVPAAEAPDVDAPADEILDVGPVTPRSVRRGLSFGLRRAAGANA